MATTMPPIYHTGVHALMGKAQYHPFLKESTIILSFVKSWMIWRHESSQAGFTQSPLTFGTSGSREKAKKISVNAPSSLAFNISSLWIQSCLEFLHPKNSDMEPNLSKAGLKHLLVAVSRSGCWGLDALTSLSLCPWWPLWMMSYWRCCQKLRKGARPVPGPTMMIGTVVSSGIWKVWALQRKKHIVTTVSTKLSVEDEVLFLHRIHWLLEQSCSKWWQSVLSLG